jgi:hypothetical protein
MSAKQDLFRLENSLISEQPWLKGSTNSLVSEASKSSSKMFGQAFWEEQLFAQCLFTPLNRWLGCKPAQSWPLACE